MQADAPVYAIPARRVVAVEHPMVIKNVDNALKTFRNVPLHDILEPDDHQGSLPLYLRQNDPAAAPIISQSMPSTNVVLKLTVPMRTGRKRKRGSNDPFEADDVVMEDAPQAGQSTNLRSHSRLDKPQELLQSLRDNAHRYEVEVIGSIDTTHRYRGLADFHYSTTHGRFMTNFREKLLPLDLEQMKQFQFDLSRGPKVNDELLPPPRLTDQPLPFNWGYHQNPAVKLQADRVTGAPELINQYAPVKINTQRLDCDDPMPSGPAAPIPNEPILCTLIEEIRRALDERPIWTRRGLTNRLRGCPGFYLLKPALPYVTYQFRGGPFRDALIKYGIDPRSDPAYRQYQTLFFKLFQTQDKKIGSAWEDPRSEYNRQLNKPSNSNDSHIFDGKSVTLDGKVWQVCDITEPILQRLLSTDLLRETCDTTSDGWYHNGTWAKVKAVMRSKLTAIRAGVEMPDELFDEILSTPDIVSDKTKVNLNPPAVPGVTVYYSKRRQPTEVTGKPIPRSKPLKRGLTGSRSKSAGNTSTNRSTAARRAREDHLLEDSHAMDEIPVDPSLMDLSGTTANAGTGRSADAEDDHAASQTADESVEEDTEDTAADSSGTDEFDDEDD